jgi:hypothetical protein
MQTDDIARDADRGLRRSGEKVPPRQPGTPLLNCE